MNHIMKEYWGVFEMYQAIRNQLVEILTDEDLAFSLGGNTLSLGALCHEMGETQASYIDSFKTLKHNYGLQVEAAGHSQTVAQLKAWYTHMDAELKEIVSAFTDEQLQTAVVDRGPGFTLPLNIQLEVYKEALLIFYGKTTIYLKAMEKALPQQMAEWIC
ncbi:MAG: hypothetical protein KDE51_04145 [Anaerolineales bacterium]|nr:hypothetical protein [Anaerolineales bacterium]